MSLMDITHESLSRQLSQAVPEVYVIVAKHTVLGMDEDTIREVIGCTKEDLDVILNDALYREVRLIIGAAQAESVVDLTTGWDKLEQHAVTNLVDRVKISRDPDFLLRVAAVANKAQRRHSQGKSDGVLDPAHAGTRKINLTTRLVERFQRNDGTQVERGIERQLSITDGSAANPSFDEIDDLLHVSANPALPRQIEVKTAMPDVDYDELDEEMKRILP
jgi:hypothetical protein